MDFTTVLIFSTILLLSWIFLKKRPNLPPGPMGLPFVGALPLMNSMKTRPAFRVMEECAKKYGNIFGIRLGTRYLVVISDLETIKEAYVKHSDVFSDRPNFLPTLKTLIKEGPGIILSSYDKNLKLLRRFTLQTLRDFGVGKTSLEERVRDEIEAISKALVDSNEIPVNINSLFQKGIGNIIYGIVFGRRFDFEDPEFIRIQTLLDKAFTGPGMFTAPNFFPKFLLYFIPVAKSVAQSLENNREMMEFMQDRIKEHEDSYDENNIRDFIDLYLKIEKEDEQKDDSAFTRGNILRVITDLFLAGSETTSLSLTWAFLFMSEFPEIQEKCQQEIHEVIGEKVPEFSDREKMPFVEATLKEIQRHANVVPLALPHVNLVDSKLKGYDIPKNSIIISNLAAVSMDEKYWNNPKKFDPSRFLNKHGKCEGKNEALIPFSVGPRVCLGEPLARMELFLMFTGLLQRFTFKREDPNKPHSMQSRPTGVTNLPEPFQIRAVQRK